VETKLKTVAITLLALALSAPGSALAYIDPNAGGLLFQILAPLFLLVVAFWAAFKRKVGALWAKLASKLRRKDPPERA
jgi:hypothetical protein